VSRSVARRRLDQDRIGAFVLQPVGETAGGLGQHGQRTGAFGVVGFVDVVDQAAHADDDRREGGHEHDEAEL
jgi:hypothetical protein